MNSFLNSQIFITFTTAQEFLQ